MYTVYIENAKGQRVAAFTVVTKKFSTGSTGFFGVTKADLEQDGSKGYQLSFQAVKIGSKPSAAK